MKMRELLRPFTINKNSTIQEALCLIDINKKGFLVVLDGHERVNGVLTDGDIRRGLIKGMSIKQKVDSVYTKEAKTIFVKNDIFEVISLFKNEAIKFLPIIDEDRCLVNIITKCEMYTLLLQDIQADLNYDFLTLDEKLIDTEVFQKPWGFYKTTMLNEYFQSKIINIKPNGQLSLQLHKYREEYWIIVHGEGRVQIDESNFCVCCGNMIFIPKGARHRIININENDSLILTEVQIGDYLGEDDIVRYEDIYGRAGS